MTRERLFVIDAFAHIFRAFYAVKNIDFNAVYGFTMMLRKLIADESPEYLAVAFDSVKPSFRKDLYPDYKANRLAAPEDLLRQVPLVKEVIQAYQIPILESPGFEADDIMGTLAHRGMQAGLQVVLVSSDKDLLQLVHGDDVVMYDDSKGVHYLGEDGLPDHFGCEAGQIVDLLTLWGDSSDNVPGVRGIGEKGAKQLLAQYGNVEAIYDHIDEIKRKNYREALARDKEKIPLMRDLVTIKTDLPLEWDLSALRWSKEDPTRLQPVFEKLRFRSLLDHVSESDLQTRQATYRCLNREESLKNFVQSAMDRGFAAFDLETTALNPLDAEIAGVALCIDPGEAVYVPFRHPGISPDWQAIAENHLKPLFQRGSMRLCAHNLKFDLSVLLRNGWDVQASTDDTMVMSYLWDPLSNQHSLDFLAEKLLSYRTIPFSEVCGEGTDADRFDQVGLEEATQYAGEDADICLQLYQRLSKRLSEFHLDSVYEEIDNPLVPVLARMELRGVCLEKTQLHKLASDLGRRILDLEREIQELAGEPFKVSSPKQLGCILFERMGLPTQKKTAKTKAYSTAQSVLEKLASQGHEIAHKLLEYRMLSKLKSTYAEKLPGMIHLSTGRIHSSFNQVVTATGRLSSTDPNLQNIPVRSDVGREIRAAFLPQPGWTLIAADYSQIELRLLAHFSGDPTLVKGFLEGEDIHARTASEIMGVPLEEVTSDMRRAAKSINFGLIYGMGEYRLSQELGIPVKQARDYMTSYFEKMPRVPEFQARIHAQAREKEEIRTMFGRRRPLPEINSRNQNLQRQGERLAVNTLIQGSAADIIKLAMIRLDQRLAEQRLEARLLLQVHDELVLECPPDQLEATIAVLKDAMENAVALNVPLTLDVHCGQNWRDAK